MVQINYQQENIRLKEELEKSKAELEYIIQGDTDMAEVRNLTSRMFLSLSLVPAFDALS